MSTSHFPHPEKLIASLNGISFYIFTQVPVSVFIPGSSSKAKTVSHLSLYFLLSRAVLVQSGLSPNVCFMLISASIHFIVWFLWYIRTKLLISPNSRQESYASNMLAHWEQGLTDRKEVESAFLNFIYFTHSQVFLFSRVFVFIPTS